jgi:hypothetical protein
MAKVTGLLQIEGSLDNLCFYKTAYGYVVRRKGGVSKEKVKHHPAFARTRENGADFARTRKAVELFRQAFKAVLQRASDVKARHRLMSLMYKVMATDQVNPRGQRKVASGQLESLQGFEYNEKHSLGSTFYSGFSVSVDRASGRIVLDFPAFSPKETIFKREGATHFRLFAGAGAVDFDNESRDVATSRTVLFPRGRATGI